MSDKLSFNTRKSLYEPVEIEIDETVYQNQKLTRAVLAKLTEFEAKIIENKEDALFNWVFFLFGVDMKILEKLDKREVEDIYLHASKVFRKEEQERFKKEIAQIEGQLGKKIPKKKIPRKNVKRPGSKV